MSVEGQVLGASTIAGGGGATAAELANTGNPIVIGLLVGLVTILALGLLTRLAHKA